MPYSPHENLCGFCGEVCGSNNEISRKTGQTIFLVRIIRHIQMVLRQKVRVERHALIVYYRALLNGSFIDL